MRVLGGHRALGRHPGVTERVAAVDVAKGEAVDDLFGETLLLEELDGVADAHHPQLRMPLGHPALRAGRGQGAGEDGVARPHLDLHIRAALGGKLVVERRPVVLRVRVVHRDLRPTVDRGTPIDREPRAVRAAVAELDQHRRHKLPEPGAKVRVLCVQSDNSAHDDRVAPVCIRLT